MSASPKAPSSPKAAPASPKAAPASPKAGSASPKVAPASPKAAAPASPKVGSKRALDSSDAKGSSAKKSKAAGSDEYQLNFNKALDKKHEGKTFSEIIKLPPSALQGLAGKADAMLAAFNIKTIEDLGKWRFYLTARAIATLAKTEEKNKRPADSRANINKALDKEHEKKSLTAVLKEPVSALQGLAEWADNTLKPLGAGKIQSLADWKFCAWAEAFTQLAQFETADGSSA